MAISNHMIFLGLLVFLMLLVPAPVVCAQALLPLNKLNQCADLTTVQQMVDSNSTIGLCRLPRNRFERAIDEKAKIRMIGAKYCLADPPPVSFLQEFSCVQTDYAGSVSMACYKSIDEKLIEDYKNNYESYREPVRAYLNSTSNCPLARKNATIDPLLFGAPLTMEVAKVELGFKLGVGTTTPPRSMIGHEFAVLDDSLELNGHRGLEILTFHSPSNAAPPTSDSETHTIGNLIVSISNDLEFAKMFRRASPRELPFHMEMVSFDFKKRPLTGGDIYEYRKLPFKIADRIGEFAEIEGMEKMDNDDFEEISGKILNEYIANLKTHVPYGMRSSGAFAYDQTAVFYLTESHMTCAGTGSIGLFVMTHTPQRETLDIGGAGFFAMGVGECGTSSASRRYMKNLVKQINEAVLLYAKQSAQ